MVQPGHSTEDFTVRLSPEEGKALDFLAARMGTTRDDAVRVLFLRGAQVAVAIERESSEQNLSNEELLARVVRGFLASLPDGADIDPNGVRMIAQAYERAAEELESQNRKHVADGLRNLQESIRLRTGSIPDIESLIGEGRNGD